MSNRANSAPAPMAPAGAPLARAELRTLGILILVAVVIRVLLLKYVGHATDIGTFESWTQSLAISGPKAFYSHVGFVDYPPGYMLVLWLMGGIYTLLGGGAGTLLLVIVKLPAVAADLFLVCLTYLIARRWWPSGKALVAAAVIALNPAIWLISAYWGQADSVAAVFLVWAFYLALTQRFEFAWAALAFAVLIKPQPLVVAPLLLIWQIRHPGWTWRLALAPVIGLAVAYIGSVGFAPQNDPYHVLAWLYDRYHVGVGVYPFNSVNAFNLYSIAPRNVFWQPDNVKILGIPQWTWGIGIFLALLAAVGSRLWRTSAKDTPAEQAEQSMVLAWFVALLGLFMLTTRMHERYMFSALAIAPLLWNIGKSYRWITVILSATYVVNLGYALHYLYQPSPMWEPQVVHPLSLINVLCLFIVAGMYLIAEMGAKIESWLGERSPAIRPTLVRGPLAREGLVGWSRADYLIVAGLMLVTAALVFYHLGAPRERVFDEIYYARAAHEYWEQKPQYEWTHPPLTKLMMAGTAGFSAWLAKHAPPQWGFRDVDPLDARIADALVAVLTIPLLFGFAKRLFSSTWTAVIAVFLLLTSGYFYVQARIATPEIVVAFFSLASLYCGYRLWISSQLVSRKDQLVYPDGTTMEGGNVRFPSGELVAARKATSTTADQTTTWRVDRVETVAPSSTVVWNRDGTIAAEIDGIRVRDAQAWLPWLSFTAVSLGCLVASKWNGLFDLIAIWLVAGLVTGQRIVARQNSTRVTGVQPVRLVWGNPYGWRLPIFMGIGAIVIVGIYLLTYIPFFHIGASNLNLDGNLKGLWGLQKQMYWYHHNLVAKHPYSSSWWTWPLELRPVSYYYHQFSAGPPQIVAEILALPNPAVWLGGLISVPLAAVFAWRERHKGIMLLIVAYLLHWLPWIASPRIDFQYNFYPNLAIICLCTTYALQRFWRASRVDESASGAMGRRAIAVGYLVLCLALFIYFLPVLGGDHITYDQWRARMWLPYGPPGNIGWI